MVEPSQHSEPDVGSGVQIPATTGTRLIAEKIQFRQGLELIIGNLQMRDRIVILQP
jgi:hypothetical protein